MSGHAPAGSGPGHLPNWQAWIEPCKQALLGVLEEQAVSVAKAGLCATFPARTGVIAAANPHKVLILTPNLRKNLKTKNQLMIVWGRPIQSRPLLGCWCRVLHILAAESSCMDWGLGSVAMSSCKQHQLMPCFPALCACGPCCAVVYGHALFPSSCHGGSYQA